MVIEEIFKTQKKIEEEVATIDDSSSSNTQVYSSQKVDMLIEELKKEINKDTLNYIELN